MGGVIVGVRALVLVIGVMNGLQTDLREKILVGEPDLRVLTYGEDLRMDDWRHVLDARAPHPGRRGRGAVRAHPGTHVGGHDYTEGVVVLGIEPGHRRRSR